MLEYLSQQVSSLSGARFIKSMIALGLIFLLKHSIDFRGGYSHPVTEEHHPESFFVEQGGAIFLQECLALKVSAWLLPVIMLHFPGKKNSFSPGVSGSLALFCAAWFWQI